MFKILLVEDDKHINYLIEEKLKEQGYLVVCAYNGKTAYDLFLESHIDLIVTDIMMPFLNGYELAEKIRESNKTVPILMLSALGEIEDKQKGFNLGIDDYIVKPLEFEEFFMRIKALLRRNQQESELKIELKTIRLYFKDFSVFLYNQRMELTKKQFLLLFKLLSNPNKIFTREMLMNEIWGYENYAIDRTVDTHISWLREKVKCDDFEIKTIRGLGYKAVIK